MSKSDLDSEWLEALEVEGGEDVDDNTPDDDTTPNDEGDDNDTGGKPGDDAGADDGSDEGEDSKGAEDSDGDDSKGAESDGEKSDNDDGDKPADDKPTEAPKEEDATKLAVKEALKEIETSKTDRSTALEGYKSEVAKSFYPEGIDRQLRDSDGDPITSIDDLTKLINPKTNDYFTDEEAGSYLLSAQQKLNKDVEEVEKFIEDVADVNLNIEDGAKRVADKYGDVLSKNTELKDRLLQAYNKTLIKDPNTGIAIKAPMEVEEFFDIALEPMINQQSKEVEGAAKAAKEAEEAAKKSAKSNQSERGDLKPSGQSESLAPEDEEWAEAEKAYQKGEIR